MFILKRIITILTILLLVFCSVLSIHAPDGKIKSNSATEKADDINYRLPNNTTPILYELTLKSNINDFSFEAALLIQIYVISETTSVVLNAWNLSIEESFVTISNLDTYYEIVNQEYDPIRQFYTITLNESLEKDKIYTIKFGRFSGNINDENFGYYRASYEDENGNNRWIAITQFAATGARWVFPCFDEPHYKARFKIVLIRPKIYHSVSNMPLQSTINTTEDYDIDVYQVSEKMSTYLVAFAITDFGRSITQDDGSTMKQSVYARQEAINKNLTEYALLKGRIAMKELEIYTGISYDFDKMDQMAIPNRYFIWSAMKNWGLITYKEKFLLYDTSLSTTSEKQKTLTIISHEHAHQWFGNLVSPMWWSYIWLNEGFARYFETYIADKIDRSMQLMHQFVTNVYRNALEYDGTLTTRPMTFDAESPEEILNIFDIIAYDKAASIIRMMNGFLTQNVLQKGLQNYLNHTRYAVARPEDLWNNLQIAVDEASNETSQFNLLPDTIRNVMSTWELHSGYPLLRVKILNESDRIEFSQTRFIGESTEDNSEEIWSIPINIATQSSPDFLDTTATHWLTQRIDYTSPTEHFSGEEWIIVNKQQTGYYRVLYDLRNYYNIINYLDSTERDKVHVLNRAQLIDDAFNLAKSGLLDYEIALNMTRHLSMELNYIPLSSFFNAVKSLDPYISYTNEYALFKKYVISLLEFAYEYFGTDIKEEDTHLDTFARADVIYWLCKYGHLNCRISMNDALNTGEIQQPDMQTSVYCSGVTTIDQWHWLWNQYATEKMDTRKERLLNALGCIEDLTVLMEYLLAIINGEMMFAHPDDAIVALRSVCNSYAGTQLLLDIIVETFPTVNKTFNYDEISTIFQGIAVYLTTDAQLAQLSSFVDSVHILESDSNLHAILLNTIIVVENNVFWSKKNLPGIITWLNENYESAITTTNIPEVTPDVTTTKLPEPITTQQPKPTTEDSETTTSCSNSMIFSILLVILSFASFYF